MRRARSRTRSLRPTPTWDRARSAADRWWSASTSRNTRSTSAAGAVRSRSSAASSPCPSWWCAAALAPGPVVGNQLAHRGQLVGLGRLDGGGQGAQRVVAHPAPGQPDDLQGAFAVPDHRAQEHHVDPAHRARLDRGPGRPSTRRRVPATVDPAGGAGAGCGPPRVGVTPAQPPASSRTATQLTTSGVRRGMPVAPFTRGRRHGCGPWPHPCGQTWSQSAGTFGGSQPGIAVCACRQRYVAPP